MKKLTLTLSWVPLPQEAQNQLCGGSMAKSLKPLGKALGAKGALILLALDLIDDVLYGLADGWAGNEPRESAAHLINPY